MDADDEIAVVESVQSANSIFAPAAGKIVAINEALLEQPELVNQDPFGRGWLFKMKPDDPSGLENLLDTDAYEAFLPEEDE